MAGIHADRAEEMRRAAVIGRTPSPVPGVLHELIDELGPWLATEYAVVHGEKAVRP